MKYFVISNNTKGKEVRVANGKFRGRVIIQIEPDKGIEQLTSRLIVNAEQDQKGNVSVRIIPDRLHKTLKLLVHKPTGEIMYATVDNMS
jgi:hypothetical protein